MLRAKSGATVIEQLVDQVDGTATQKSVLRSQKQRHAYLQQLDKATSAGFAQDRKSREESWNEAQKHRLS
jgi:ribosomal protein L37E